MSPAVVGRWSITVQCEVIRTDWFHASEVVTVLGISDAPMSIVYALLDLAATFYVGRSTSANSLSQVGLIRHRTTDTAVVYIASAAASLWSIEPSGDRPSVALVPINVSNSDQLYMYCGSFEDERRGRERRSVSAID